MSHSARYLRPTRQHLVLLDRVESESESPETQPNETSHALTKRSSLKVLYAGQSPKGDTRGSPSMLRCRQFFCHRTAKQPNDSCHMLDARVSTGGHCPSQIISRPVPAIRKLL